MLPTYIISDIHGHVDPVRTLLKDADLITANGAWCGGPTALWVLGDFFDHGPDGLGAVNLVRRLQRQAAEAGGSVEALLGNHDVLFLAAYRFGRQPSAGPGGNFIADWEENGGVVSDLANLTPAVADWLATLPALARTGQTLLAHADGLFYRRYGQSVAEVNRNIRHLLQSEDKNAWQQLLDDFGEHRTFLEDGPALKTFLDCYGGQRLVHGHTPISKIIDQPAETVNEPLLYAEGRCVNVDGGMYLGGPGCFYQLPA